MKKLLYYKTPNGKCPFISWVLSLSIVFQVRIEKRLDNLMEGLMGDCKRLKDSKLSELRLKFGAGYRIYFRELNDIVILLIAGSDKKEQNKTIKQAEKYFEDFLSRAKKGQENE